MMTLTPQAVESPGLSLKRTHVSTPSIIEHKASQQSITASEDYHSLSSSNFSDDRVHDSRALSTNTIQRFQTPPSRYRTPPQQPRDYLPQQENASQEEVRQTPMRGQGRRRQSVGEPARIDPAVAESAGDPPAAALIRDGGVRRKPVPATVMEDQEEWPRSKDEISPTRAQSSVAQDINRESDAPTPGIDDTPFIHFALDQLTRDEEVRGSRRYRGIPPEAAANYPYIEDPPTFAAAELREPGRADPLAPDRAERQPIPGVWAQQRQQIFPDEPPPRNPRRPTEFSPQQPGKFLPIASEETRQMPLHFLPGILRPTLIGSFLLLLLAYLACLLFCSIWSLRHPGLWDYRSFGDGRYFTFQYLPTLLGMILFLWLVQIEVAVYRIAPFMAMSSSIDRSREEGTRLPMYPPGFILPYAGHFRAGQPIVGVFMVIAWFQIWTVPLLGSSFNVHFFGSGSSGHWRWIATQGAIWGVIGLYALLFVALVLLLVYLRRITGLRWDPRSLADIAVLLERSNALSMDHGGNDSAPWLGYWRASNRPDEVFHTVGLAEREGRSYGIEDGRIHEKPAGVIAPPTSRSADMVEMGRQRHSSEKMLARPSDEENGSSGFHSRAVPGFLRPSSALLWPVIAIVLLLAFLIVSYLPTTRVSAGFNPDVPAPVNNDGFSGTNFLYSFIPGLLAMLCFLFWMDIDYAYRRLQPYASLSNPEGELAERSLLVSYSADLPGLITASAMVNRHWKVAILSFTTLIAAALPVLAGGVFWAQFYVAKQTVQISAHMPAYHALTVLVTIFALAFLLTYPSHRLRSARVPNKATSFADVLALFHQSRLLDDVAFHSPASKTDLVTRLLSGAPGVRVSGQLEEAGASKVSLADSVRGFGRARQRALVGLGVTEVPRYVLGRYSGRDGSEYIGIDRIRK